MKKAITTFLIIFIGIGFILKDDNKNEKVQVRFIQGNPTVKSAVDPIEQPTSAPIPTGKKAQVSNPKAKIEAIKLARYYADQYGVNQETLLCVLNDESGVESHYPDTGELKCGDNGQSCGIGQIKLATWGSIRKHAGWTTEDLRWNDMENIRTTAYGISHGWKMHWTGYRKCIVAGHEEFN